MSFRFDVMLYVCTLSRALNHSAHHVGTYSLLAHVDTISHRERKFDFTNLRCVRSHCCRSCARLVSSEWVQRFVLRGAQAEAQLDVTFSSVKFGRRDLVWRL